MVVLDTDHMSLLEWSGAQGSARLRARLTTFQPAEVVTTIISYEEQVRGWMAYIARLRSVTQQVDAYRRLHRQLDNYCRIHVLLPALQAALHTLGDAPTRSLAALAQWLGVAEAETATVVPPLAEAPAPVAAAPAAGHVSPLLPMTGRDSASSAPKTLLNRRTVIAARTRTTR
jgi:hypothetical protein